MAAQLQPVVSARLAWVDRLRGLAIALMVLDHVLVQVAPTSIVRYTATRLSLPLFMAAGAAVWRPRSTGRPLWVRVKRPLRLLVASKLEGALLATLGMARPGIVTVFMLVSFVPLWGFGESVRRWPALWLIGGLVQALYRPLGWAGYEPGLVLAWWCLGVLGAAEFEAIGARLPRWLAPIGRRPLSWYVGHLLVLAVVVAVA